MSNAACAKWILCSNDDSSEAQKVAEMASIEAVMDEWFAVPGIAAQLEYMYDGPTRNAGMNLFFTAYEAGNSERCWKLLKEIQEQIR